MGSRTRRDTVIARPDIAAAKPGFPDSAAAGFEFVGEFPRLDPIRHAVTVVAIDRAGRETVLDRKSLIPPRAMDVWRSLLDANPALADRPFHFLMMTSGVAAGGAAEVDSAYRPYLSRTAGVGTSTCIACAARASWPRTICMGSSATRSKSASLFSSSSTAASGPTRAATPRSGTSTTVSSRTSTTASGRRTTSSSRTTI